MTEKQHKANLAKQRRYRESHRAILLEKSRSYNAAHAEERRRYGREYYAKNSKKIKAWHAANRKNNPEQTSARHAVNYALSMGKLVRGPCETPGCKQKAQAHHDDYSKKLDVRWLCGSCHHRLHRSLNQVGPEPVNCDAAV